MKSKKRILTGAALLCIAAIAGVVYLSRPERTYYLSISTNSRAPSTFLISDYRYEDYWLWYREHNGNEYTINLHSSQVIIREEPPEVVTSQHVIRENILGIGTYLDSMFRGAAGAT